MHYLPSDVFTYRDGRLYCEEIPAEELIKEHGTPLYVYSKKFFSDRFLNFTDAFKDLDHTVYFAAKSNFNLNVIKLFYDLGAGVDVNSEGEFLRAKKAGVDPKRMILTGVGKTPNEIRLGLEEDMLMIKAESIDEIQQIDAIAGSLGITARVAIRINPDVDPVTHPYVATGQAESKFGIDTPETLAIYRRRDEFKNIRFTGIDMHLGSQLTTIAPYVEAVEKVAEMIKTLRGEGLHLEHFDLGGGYGVMYKDEEPFAIHDLAQAVTPVLKDLDIDIFFEPGRYLTANGGVLLTDIIYTKEKRDKHIVVVDAAMTDLLRPSIYGSYHHIQPVLKHTDRGDFVADVVGPVCESGDFLAKKRELEIVEHGESLAVMSAGAYGMAMASNYNARRRPPEIIVDGGKQYVTRSRESFDYLMWDEEIKPELHK